MKASGREINSQSFTASEGQTPTPRSRAMIRTQFSSFYCQDVLCCIISPHPTRGIWSRKDRNLEVSTFAWFSLARTFFCFLLKQLSHFDSISLFTANVLIIFWGTCVSSAQKSSVMLNILKRWNFTGRVFFKLGSLSMFLIINSDEFMVSGQSFSWGKHPE
jgi:hypothetical protein